MSQRLSISDLPDLGRGAVREVIEMILKAQDKWDEALARYLKD